jgi:hypothetical protein
MRWCAHIIATLFLSLTSQKNAALVLSLLPKYSNRDLNPPSHPFSPKVPDKPFHGPLYGNRCVWPGVPPTPSRVASYSAHLILPPVRRCPQIRDVPPASLAIVLGSCIMLVPARCPPLYLARCPIETPSLQLCTCNLLWGERFYFSNVSFVLFRSPPLGGRLLLFLNSPLHRNQCVSGAVAIPCR